MRKLISLSITWAVLAGLVYAANLDEKGNTKVRITNTGASQAIPVDVNSSALPTGAATSAKQDTGNASLSSIDSKITAVNTGAVTVSSSALPTGAATAAKQPALGTAGSASADVLTVQGIASMTPLKVDGSGVTQPVSGTVTANAGTGPWPVTDNGGSLTVDGTVAATQSGTWNVGTVSTITNVVHVDDNSSTLSVDDGGGSLTVDGTVTASNAAGDVAHDGVDSGNPVKIGFQAKTSLPTAVADADRVNGIADKFGRQVILTNAMRDITGSQTTTITSSTSETTIVTAGGAGVFRDITHISITNKSASDTLVTLKDSTGGTTRGIWNIPAGGGIVLPYNTPKKQATANNNWTLTCGTSVDSVYAVVEFIDNK
jgi:hypothetical protein